MKLLSLHLQSFIFACKKIIKSPLEHLINVLVLSLIITLLLGAISISKSNSQWEDSQVSYPQITVYFKANASSTDISNIENTLNQFNKKAIRSYQFISKEQAADELKADQQLKSIASDVIDSSALPDVLIVSTTTSNPKILKQLSDRISSQPMVDSVDLDTSYASKVNDLLGFSKRITLSLEVIFTLILVLVIYNMVRLQMLLRQDEIIVSRLIGASDSFIMRPLLYYVIAQITLGFFLSILMLNTQIELANQLFNQFGNLFGAGFRLTHLNIITLIEGFVIVTVFSIFAVFVAVQWIFKHSYVK